MLTFLPNSVLRKQKRVWYHCYPSWLWGPLPLRCLRPTWTRREFEACMLRICCHGRPSSWSSFGPWLTRYQVESGSQLLTAVMYHGIPYFSMHSSVRHHWKDQVESSARLLLCASTLFRLPGKRMISLEKASSGAHHQLEIRSEWLGQG